MFWTTTHNLPRTIHNLKFATALKFHKTDKIKINLITPHFRLILSFTAYNVDKLISCRISTPPNNSTITPPEQWILDLVGPAQCEYAGHYWMGVGVIHFVRIRHPLSEQSRHTLMNYIHHFQIGRTPLLITPTLKRWNICWCFGLFDYATDWR